jgi:hypothetical protein
MQRTDPMMSMSASPHPLDIDLLDLIEGTLSPDPTRAIEVHLATCVLCRIKRQRLSDEAPIDPVDLGDVEIPAFGHVEIVDAPAATAAPGELWLTDGDEALMVLLRDVRDPLLGVVVMPVTFETDVADSGTVILDSAASPLGVPLAIYDGMLSRLPLHVLRSRVVPARDVDLSTLAVGEPGVSRGSSLEGPADPRHEVRQNIADRLAALSPVHDDFTPTDVAPDSDTFGMVQEQLKALHNGNTTVERFATPGGCPDGWIGLGRILQRHLSLLIIGTPAGLITEADYVAARGMAVRWHASALIVCPRQGRTVDLYTPKGLYDAMQVPLGQRSPEPTVSGLDLIDSVRKFFDLHPLWHVPASSETRQVSRVDVSKVLERNVHVATARLAERSVRGAGKPEAYERASTQGDQLAAILQRALEGTLVPEDIQAVVDGHQE